MNNAKDRNNAKEHANSAQDRRFARRELAQLSKAEAAADAERQQKLSDAEFAQARSLADSSLTFGFASGDPPRPSPTPPRPLLDPSCLWTLLDPLSDLSPIPPRRRQVLLKNENPCLLSNSSSSCWLLPHPLMHRPNGRLLSSAL